MVVHNVYELKYGMWNSFITKSENRGSLYRPRTIKIHEVRRYAVSKYQRWYHTKSSSLSNFRANCISFKLSCKIVHAGHANSESLSAI